MHKTFLTLILTVFSVSLFAQGSYVEVVRSTIKTEKKALISEVMQLSEAEGNMFWPIYNEYDEKLYKINSTYFDVIKEFAANFDNMSDEAAKDILKRASKVSLDKTKLEKAYLKKFMKVISPQKTLRFMQASGKIDIMIEAQLASEIPLLEDLE